MAEFDDWWNRAVILFFALLIGLLIGCVYALGYVDGHNSGYIKTLSPATQAAWFGTGE